MNTPQQRVDEDAERGRIERRLGTGIVLFLLCATLPYLWLIDNFGYDNILREPTAVILRNMQQGGAPLVLAWWAFAMSALLFIPVAQGFRRLLESRAEPDRGALVLGTASAIAQSVGLLRWVLVVPALAATFNHPDSTATAREATVVVFDAVHRYGGMVIGEMVGQLLLAAWTALVALGLWRTRAVPRALAAVGLFTVPLWLIGQTELLHVVIPSLPAIEVTPLAFMTWEAWLLMLAVSFLGSAWRRRSRWATSRS